MFAKYKCAAYTDCYDCASNNCIWTIFPTEEKCIRHRELRGRPLNVIGADDLELCSPRSTSTPDYLGSLIKTQKALLSTQNALKVIVFLLMMLVAAIVLRWLVRLWVNWRVARVQPFEMPKAPTPAPRRERSRSPPADRPLRIPQMTMEEFEQRFPERTPSRSRSLSLQPPVLTPQQNALMRQSQTPDVDDDVDIARRRLTRHHQQQEDQEEQQQQQQQQQLNDDATSESSYGDVEASFNVQTSTNPFSSDVELTDFRSVDDSGYRVIYTRKGIQKESNV